MIEGFLTEQEVSDLLAVSPRTLRHWRTQGKGPKFVQLEGKAIRYPEAELAEYLSRQPTGGRAA